MGESISERRLAENEVMFRSLNESVQERIDEVNRTAAETGDTPMQIGGDEPLFFYCECADEKCRQRVKLAPDEYKRIHKSRNTFSIVCGHEVPEIEDVIAKEKSYCVVRKHVMPPQKAQQLHPTFPYIA